MTDKSVRSKCQYQVQYLWFLPITVSNLQIIIYHLLLRGNPPLLSHAYPWFYFNSRLIADLSSPITFAILLFNGFCCLITKIMYLFTITEFIFGKKKVTKTAECHARKSVSSLCISMKVLLINDMFLTFTEFFEERL